MALSFRALSPFALLVFLVAACGPGTGSTADSAGGTTGARSTTAQPTAAQLTATLRSADSTLQAAVAARDVERTIAFYAEDAVLLPAASPIITGREAIRAEWVKLYAIPGFANTARLTNVEVAAGGDMAYTRGSYETRLMGHDGKLLTERGKWVSIWRRDASGAWRIIVDTYNTDTPPPDHL